MSCYVLNGDNIGTLSVMYSGHLREHEYKRHTIANIIKAIPTRETLADSLYIMNVRAFSARYDDATEKEIPRPDFTFRGQPNTCRLLKLLQSYLYQCAEGNIPEEPLYKAMQDYERDLMQDIIEKLPEYEEAIWA